MALVVSVVLVAAACGGDSPDVDVASVDSAVEPTGEPADFDCERLMTTSITYGFPEGDQRPALETVISRFFATKLPRFEEPVPDLSANPTGSDRVRVEVSEGTATVRLTDTDVGISGLVVHLRRDFGFWRVGGYSGCDEFLQKYSERGPPESDEELELETTSEIDIELPDDDG